jgi:hypothetical protein
MSKVATLTEPWAPRERERHAPTFSGTGPAGATLASAQSISRPSKPKAAPKVCAGGTDAYEAGPRAGVPSYKQTLIAS